MSDRDADLKMDHIRSVEQTNFPLICVSGIADQLLLKLGYNARLFEANAIHAMLGHLANLVVSLVEGPQTAIGELNMLSPAERRMVLTDWNQTQASFPDQVCVHQLFERWVFQTPDAIVLEEGETRIRFDELNRRANQLAQRLHRMGVGPEDLVGLCFDRSINMIVSMLAVLKAGAAYLPLDPNLPQARMDFMLEDAQVKCVLTISKYTGLIQSVRTPVLDLDEIKDNLLEEMVEKPAVEVRPENLAYVIYTSGSTGQPKGVQVEHRGLCNLVHYNHRCLEMGPGSRTMQYLSFIFDGSVGEIFSALTSGGTLVLAPVGLLPGPELVQWLDEEEITHAFLTPSMMVSMPYNRLPALHSIQTGGEVLTADIVRVWAPGRIFTNGYGPTEATVASSVHFVNEQDYDGANIPIGRPLANSYVYLLDANLQPVPVGLTGELYTAGVHLARGYLNRPGLTAERFVANPFYPQDPDAPQRLYRTGDLARYRPDGEIEYLGRTDHQVKIRGFRIELGEIEAILHEQPGIAQTAVIVQTAASGDRRLAAFYTFKTDHEEDVDVLQLREELRKKLPPYMIPTTFTLLEQMPYTASGKVDRKALETRSANPDRPGEHILVRPRDILEAWLVEIWEDLLGVADVGVQDDFFELGGHSLLAVRLLGQIEQRFGQRIDISKLYIEPTVEHLAGILREKPQISSDVLEQLIVPMQSKGDLPPIFFIHPSGGTVHFYADLARAMGRDRPFYGIEAQGLNRELPLQSCVEDMASLYIQAVRTVQPEGPYRLASWSMGVVIAYEMACQLRESGQDVSLLALFDQGPVLPAAEPVDDAAYLVSVFGKDLPLVEADLRRLTAEEQIQFVWAAARKAHFIFPNITLDQFEHFVRILRTQTEAWRHYHPRSYSGKVTLFRAERQPEDGPVARDMGWGGLATQVDVIDVPGDHLTMIHLPHVKPLSQKLRQCLQYADQREISTQNMERV